MRNDLAQTVPDEEENKMGTIELTTIGEKGEQIIYRNDYHSLKTGIKGTQPYFRITAGPISIDIEFESLIDFSNFVMNLKEYFLQTGKENISPEKAIIKVYRNDKEFLMGEYSYLEFLSHGNKPSFFISVESKTHRPFEVYFYFDIKEELEKFIRILCDGVEIDKK